MKIINSSRIDCTMVLQLYSEKFPKIREERYKEKLDKIRKILIKLKYNNDFVKNWITTLNKEELKYFYQELLTI